MRYPAVAGMFYPSNPENLERQIEILFNEAKKIELKHTNIAISPHAGYIYSGKTAAISFRALQNDLKKNPSTAIILGPNHTGLGEPIALSFDDWKTPLGVLKNNIEFAGELTKECKIITKDEMAHFHEHSIEVMLPFIQKINPQTKIVPICIGTHDKNILKILGQAIYQTTKQKKFSFENFVVIASSDFSHYLSGKKAKELDLPAIEYIKKLDIDGFESIVKRYNITICGYAPIIVAMEYAKLSGKKIGELLKYTNSGIETNSSEDQVVAYSSIIFL
jgi:AmmeMemoRadiSam system protein B